MAHSFDSHIPMRVLDWIERFTAHATAHEQRLAALLDLMERDRPPVLASAADVTLAAATSPLAVSAGAPGLQNGDAVGELRDLCAAAHQQRLDVEALLTALVGDLSRDGGRRPRVLVADDGPDNRDVLAALLETSGFDPVTAGDGLEAVLAAHCLRPAVVLLDISMPVLSGVEAARLLKASAATRHLPLIAHTAVDGLQARLDAHFAHVLRKPADPAAIVESVARLIAT